MTMRRETCTIFTPRNLTSKNNLEKGKYSTVSVGLSSNTRIDLESQMRETLSNIKTSARIAKIKEKLRNPELKKELLDRALIGRKDPILSVKIQRDSLALKQAHYQRDLLRQ